MCAIKRSGWQASSGEHTDEHTQKMRLHEWLYGRRIPPKAQILQAGLLVAAATFAAGTPAGWFARDQADEQIAQINRRSAPPARASSTFTRIIIRKVFSTSSPKKASASKLTIA